jgi:hypothetical protein
MTTTDAQSVDVVIVGDVTERKYAADFGAWNTYPVSSFPIRILPRVENRNRAVVWLSSTPDADTAVIISSSMENAQAGVGALLTLEGKDVLIESQQDVWAIKSGSGADLTVSVHDETWSSK